MDHVHLTSYRPHDPGHDYYAPGIYLITLVVRNRDHQHTLLGEFNDDLAHPAVKQSEVGRAVMECWSLIPAIQAQHGRKLVIHAACCQPDHFHGVLEVFERMEVSVGEVIRGFKSGCTQAWHQIQRPSMAAGATSGAAAGDTLQLAAGATSQPYLDERAMLKRLSKKQRAAYYAQHSEAQQPLWDDNYDDTICLSDPVTGSYDQRHLAAMIRYVGDNARRSIIRRLRPQYMQRCLHVLLPGRDQQGRVVMRDYAAFGNLFLLRWARKIQVFCHRKAPDGHTPYHTTPEYRQQCQQWQAQILAGATVIVTPGISRGESLVKEACFAHGYPLIHLQKEPIGPYWKPESKRFDLCANGTLLILAPWKADALGEVNHVPSTTDYSIFHNLNRLAAEICTLDGDATVVGGQRGE